MADKDRVALEEVTEAAFSGVLRALEARKLDVRKLPWPILVGIIAWPDPGGFEPGQIGIPGKTRAEK